MRYCTLERPFHGTCLNLTLGMGCSQLPSAICLKHAENRNKLLSEQTIKKIDIAKELGLYNDTCGSVILDVVCEICEEELVDAGKVDKINGKYICYSCQ